MEVFEKWQLVGSCMRSGSGKCFSFQHLQPHFALHGISMKLACALAHSRTLRSRAKAADAAPKSNIALCLACTAQAKVKTCLQHAKQADKEGPNQLSTRCRLWDLISHKYMTSIREIRLLAPRGSLRSSFL